ncbi:MAG: type II toxin-antitoxin system Phd/YefM family antitoxin [Candidatus Omnitrophica bacterium]|nr:type II toxin-antitoxin system Phd/YefM family antitoxin [Candidatus Omnitrophota bacterium]
MKTLTIPKLSPSFIVKNQKREAVVLSPKDYQAIVELLEELKDHLDFERRKKERQRAFREFLRELKTTD